MDPRGLWHTLNWRLALANSWYRPPFLYWQMRQLSDVVVRGWLHHIWTSHAVFSSQVCWWERSLDELAEEQVFSQGTGASFDMKGLSTSLLAMRQWPLTFKAHYWCVPDEVRSDHIGDANKILNPKRHRVNLQLLICWKDTRHTLQRVSNYVQSLVLWN